MKLEFCCRLAWQIYCGHGKMSHLSMVATTRPEASPFCLILCSTPDSSDTSKETTKRFFLTTVIIEIMISIYNRIVRPENGNKSDCLNLRQKSNSSTDIEVNEKVFVLSKKLFQYPKDLNGENFPQLPSKQLCYYCFFFNKNKLTNNYEISRQHFQIQTISTLLVTQCQYFTPAVVCDNQHKLLRSHCSGLKDSLPFYHLFWGEGIRSRFCSVDAVIIFFRLN